MNLILTMIVVIVVALSSPTYALACNEQTNDPSMRFDIENEHAVDIESGLTWMRCALGQTWNGKTCTGQASLLTWYEANDTLKEMTQKNSKNADWRLPRLNELATIVDITCKSPRINLSVFPSTPAAYYWTNSRVPRGYGEAYVISFGTDGVSSKALDTRYAVRLVRGRSNTLN